MLTLKGLSLCRFNIKSKDLTLQLCCGDLFRKAAHYVDKILKGAKPADLPVQQATKFEFIINLKAAKQIGLTIPVRVLERANQVIK